MGKPTPSDVHVNRPLTNVSIAYAQSAENYIADKVFPRVPVSKQSDRYFTFDKGDLLRDEVTERAPGTQSSGSGVAIDNTPSYNCPVYAHHEDVSDQLVANADSPLSPKRDATENITQKFLTKKDRLWATKYFAKSIWDKDWDGVAASPSTDEFLQWNDASSVPATDIAAANEIIRLATGYPANTLVLGASVFAILKNNASILERIKYTQKGVVTADLLAALFDVKQVLVAKAVYNTAKEGATAVMADIFGKAALLCYAAPAPGIRRPSGGYTFAWTGLLGAKAGAVQMSSFRMEELKSDRVEGEAAFSQKLVGADLGLFMATAIA